MNLEGSCLCGGIRFTLRPPFPGIVMCHCSLCRRSSGTAGIAKLTVPSGQLEWISGEDLIATFERPSGYGNAFCRVCGCPAPDTNRTRTRTSIPAGLVADSPNLKVAEHIYVGSKAHWDVIGDAAVRRDKDKT